MVEHPAEYRWSSYQYNALRDGDRLVTPHDLYTKLAANANKRRKKYSDLFAHHISQTSMDEIRSATNKAWVIGSDSFKEKIEKLTGRQSAPKLRGGHNKKPKAG